MTLTQITINGVEFKWPAKTISCGQICEIADMDYDSVVLYSADGRKIHPEQFIEVGQDSSFTVEAKHAGDVKVSMAPGYHRKCFIDDDIIGGPEDFPGSDF
jgi:hypothetical protein